VLFLKHFLGEVPVSRSYPGGCAGTDLFAAGCSCDKDALCEMTGRKWFLYNGGRHAFQNTGHMQKAPGLTPGGVQRRSHMTARGVLF